MHLGEETRRNRTRATMRIAWLLLSLSFLFHSVCPNDITTVSESSTTAGPSATSGGSPSGTEHLLKADPSGVPTEAQATTAVTRAGMTTMSADPQVSTQIQTSIINNSSSSHTGITSAPTSAMIDASPTPTLNPSKVTISAATTATADVQTLTPEASVSSKTSRTELSGMPTENPHHLDTSNTRKVSADTTTGNQAMTHTTTPFKMSKGDIEKTTVTVTRNGQTASRVPESARAPGTTSTPRPLTTTVFPVPDNLSGTTSLQLTASTSSTTSTSTSTTTTTTTTTTTELQPKMLQYSLNSRHEEEKDKELVEVCKRLMANLQDGNCTVMWRQHNGKVQLDSVEINGKVKTSLATQYYEEISKKATDNKTLIAILASCGALLIMIVILAVCASHHRKPYNENQQHLTEELHTVENGYHDNPTLEVMEVQPEMQEKKVALNGEFNNDSWIVPIDNLLKEDIPDEEDTHL